MVAYAKSTKKQLRYLTMEMEKRKEMEPEMGVCCCMYDRGARGTLKV